MQHGLSMIAAGSPAPPRVLTRLLVLALFGVVLVLSPAVRPASYAQPVADSFEDRVEPNALAAEKSAVQRYPGEPRSQLAALKAKLPSGIYLATDNRGAIAFKVYRNEEVAVSNNVGPEPAVYRVDKKMVLNAGQLGVAIPTTNQGGWPIELRPNFIWEKDPTNRYGTFIYLHKTPSGELDRAMRARSAKAVLIIEGVGWGTLEPVDVAAGKWGLIQVKTYFSPWMALKVNTHIVIGWQRLKNAPSADDPLRQKLEASIREWFVFKGPRNGAIDPAMGFMDFGRMGQPGWNLLAQALDEMGDSAVLCISLVANNVEPNDKVPIMSYVVQHSKGTVVRRAAMLEIIAYPSKDLSHDLLDTAVVGELLTDADPMIGMMAFLAASDKTIASNRQAVIKQLNKYFAMKDRRIVGPAAKVDSQTAENLNEGVARMMRPVIEKIGQARLTEVAATLTETMISSRDSAVPIESAIQTLNQLGAVDELGRLLLSRPDLAHAMEPAIGYLVRAERTAGANVLIKISQAARAGRWEVPESTRQRLRLALAQYCGLMEQRGPRDPQLLETKHVLAVRSELVEWVRRPEGAWAVRNLALVPRPNEKALYVAGLKSTPPNAAACIGALERIKAVDALQPLAAVLDREDAITDMYSRVRNNRLAAMPPPPRGQGNLAYLADRTLTVLTGGKPAGVPDYIGPNVLKERRDYWRRMLAEKPPLGGSLSR